MKPFFLLALTFCIQPVLAQQQSLPLSINLTDEVRMAKVFDTDTTRFVSAAETQNKTGIFIIYKKSDTLSFKHSYFVNGDAYDDGHIRQGIAYYAKTAGTYRLQFANARALFCEGCNNLHYCEVKEHKDTITVQQSWGPHAFNRIEYYRFLYTKNSIRWPLLDVTLSSSYAHDTEPDANTYTLYKPSSGVNMSNYDAETIGDTDTAHLAFQQSLFFKSNKYKALLDSLYKLPQSSFPYLYRLFSAEDADEFITEDITTKTVKDANEIGYFFEQANNLPAAEVFLTKVIKTFPKREVAYFNLGDVYVKKGMKKEAANQYAIYMKLMNERGLQQKIPQRLIDFVSDPKNQ
ncbi:hypothetical protein SAMN05421788_105225 [Filimonas lacunae]|uniref:Uncharacterized protein n=1 Tax=Filimonas lacunae TaxID=477680 RepID=A0A173MCV9_9BACT|nr:hypothetical protein [Filimonas lacunae]BAV05319.1 hypothetical protein FLA_1326 [Filimonas lacunae]SIT22010.1 hypothetical protein SAMN05421788_105225 [Filimonas lacunae]